MGREDKEKDYDSQLEKLEISLLLEGIFQLYGFDFRNYVYPSVRRRIWHRIWAEDVKSISGLQEKVLHDTGSMKRLLDDLCIRVTEMFRDPLFFLAFRTKILPLLINKPQIRIWHAGCSTGEEVYSMAILLNEEGLFDKTNIYATDINDEVINRAKQGIFPISKMQVYTKNYIKAGGARAFSDYYKVIGENAIFEPYLSKRVLFAQHNLVTDGSFNEFDVIICRNVMIYFDKILQQKVYRLFHDSLSTHGFLGLGNKETLALSELAHCYHEIDAKERLYRKIR
ncbi:CheR family methyltransferase [Desulfotomaculum sp. 1211_IL3151]|uniref:CheR family methyltransferase n=1 Tax=Desulfotomaculum sp. 1211_IL3151 TaxID=3084055 RepID=UPI002FD894C0